MANYVSNSVLFIGDPGKLAGVKTLFLDIEQKQNATNQYHRPDFVTSDHGYMKRFSPGARYSRLTC